MLTALAIAVAIHDPALKFLLATLAIGPLAGYAGIVMFRRWRQKSGECKTQASNLEAVRRNASLGPDR
jgi:hypothetical protein